MARGNAKTIDVGRVNGRHFLNIAGFGFDIAVLEHSKRVRWIRGELLYLYCALRQMKSYPGFTLKSDLGARGVPDGLKMMVIVANAQVFGGGLKIAPQAVVDDGVLDVVSFGDLSFMSRLRAMDLLKKGRHAEMSGVTTARASSMEFEFPAAPAFETDGEWRQATESKLRVEVIPRTLRVLVP